MVGHTLKRMPAPAFSIPIDGRPGLVTSAINSREKLDCWFFYLFFIRGPLRSAVDAARSPEIHGGVVGVEHGQTNLGEKGA